MAAVTEEQIRYIVAHLNDRPRTEVARRARVSADTVYQIVRKYGGEIRHDLNTRNPEYVRIVREHFADMTGSEIERQYGIRRGLANSIARDLGLKHSEATLERIAQNRRECMKTSRQRVDDVKRAARWKLVRRMDELRVMSGMPQQTRFRFKCLTEKAYRVKYTLIHRYGYYACEGETATLLYDADTHRVDEDSYTERYRLRFEEV